MTIHIFKNQDIKHFQYDCVGVDRAALNSVHKFPGKTKITISLRCPCEKAVRDNRIATMKNHILTMHEPFRHYLSYETWDRDLRV